MIKLLKRFKHYYDNLKIQVKFTLCILLAILIPILALVLLFTNQLYDMIIADTIRSEQAAAAKTAPLFDELLQDIEHVHTRITNLDYYQTLFSNPVDSPLSALAASDDAADFSHDILSLASESPVRAVRIYVNLPEQDRFFSSGNSQDLFLPMNYAKGTYWHGIFQGSPISSLYCPPFYLSNREMRAYGDCAFITSASISYQNHTIPCYIALYFSSESIQQILSDGISFSGGVSYIVNNREALIASTNQHLAGIYHLHYSDIRESLMSSNNFMERDVLGETVYAGFHYIRKPDWFLVTVLPKTPLIKKANRTFLKFFSVCLVCICASLWMAIRQSRSITDRISSVIHQMAQIKSGLPVQMPMPAIQDEVGILMSTYNYMVERMNMLARRQKQTAEELRIAEFESLQAQINPHFLYNTMDMMNWMVMQGQTAEAQNVIQSLARYYKLTLSQKRDFNTIESELEHVTIYVSLQNMRYQNTIDFFVDIPDELYRYSIPKLTLQPIVENAILHGILEKEEKSGTIVITGWMEDSGITLLISDDGIGIPADKLSRILSGDLPKRGSGNNIAISNTHRRLKLLYGPDYGLSYKSAPEAGTDVRIRIPALLPEQTNTAAKKDSLYHTYHLPTAASQKTLLQTDVSEAEFLVQCEKLQENRLTLENLSAVNARLPKGESMCLLYHEITADFPLHSHTFFEMSYVCQGELSMTIDDNLLHLTTGNLVILNTSAVHDLKYSGKPAVILNFCLSPDLLKTGLSPILREKNPLSDLFSQKKAFSRNYISFSLTEGQKGTACLTNMLETYILCDYHATFELTSLLLYFFSLLS